MFGEQVEMNESAGWGMVELWRGVTPHQPQSILPGARMSLLQPIWPPENDEDLTPIDIQ